MSALKGLFIFVFLFVILFLAGCEIKKKIINQKTQLSEEKAMPIKNKETIFLPQPKTSGEISLEEVILKRRSKRSFTSQKLTLSQISQVLWAAQGITDDKRGFRSAPSAGALYPLEIYLVVAQDGVENLEAGVYHFDPEEHSLERVLKEDLRQELAEAGLGQSAISQAPISLVITAVYERITKKYGQRGRRYVHMEVGHVGQNIYLQVEALGLGTVVIGAFNDQQVKQILGIEEEPLYIMPIGYGE